MMDERLCVNGGNKRANLQPDIFLCVRLRIDFFKETPLMLSCSSCVIEEVCHCFPSGGNLANVLGDPKWLPWLITRVKGVF